MTYSLIAAAARDGGGETGIALLLVFGFIFIVGIWAFIFIRVWGSLPEFSIGLRRTTHGLNKTPQERRMLTQADADYMFSCMRQKSLTRASAERKAEAEARRLYGDREVDAFLMYGDGPRPSDQYPPSS